MDAAREKVMVVLSMNNSIKLLNRLDEVVVFDPLSHEHLREVARLQMKDVAKRLAKKGVALAVTNAALDYVLFESYDPVYGARPIRRWLGFCSGCTDDNPNLLKYSCLMEGNLYAKP
ncbi:Chaperone protein ClpB1 [Bienertia sinuspersici]